MSLFFIRHGETALNVARVLQPSDTPLNERGLAQARALGARLAGSGIAHILSSDLPRALQTGQAIADRTLALAISESDATVALLMKNFALAILR